MQKLVLILLPWLISFTLKAQSTDLKKIAPDSSNFKNVYVKKIAEDENQSSFVIWVKHGVNSHYHERHTEMIKVISGKGQMTISNNTFPIKKGDYFVIPMGVPHSVITTSKKPIKVLSIQTPKFDGDRIWVENH